ncbi:hypothetical protein BHE74_00029354 [Ensete ventricosum]|nr:hypothetical protein BHE74_00029354 [Ensete ventricosum]
MSEHGNRTDAERSERRGRGRSSRWENRRESEQGGDGSFGFFTEEGGREGEGSDRSGRWSRDGRGGKRDAYLTVRMAVPGAGARRGRNEPMTKEI